MTVTDNIASAGRLAGRRIVVTGAASGIGKATAELFAREGARVVCLDYDESGASSAARAIGGFAVQADITNEDDLTIACGKAASHLGGIDGLVNAAGIMATGSMLEMSVGAWKRIVEVNLVGTYLVTRACLPFLRSAEAGTVVNVASAQGLLPNAPDHTAYAASKGGVVNLSRALAAELSPQVRVNAVCPGLVDTPLAVGNKGNVANYALKRIAEPGEIASAILFLTSSDSSYVTGAILAVEGGRSFH